MLFDHKYETLLENIEMHIINYEQQVNNKSNNDRTRNKTHSITNDNKRYGNSISSVSIFTTMNNTNKIKPRNKQLHIKVHNDKLKHYLVRRDKPYTAINKNTFNTKTITNSRSSNKISLTNKKCKLQHSRLSHFYLLSKQLSSFNQHTYKSSYNSHSNNDSNNNNNHIHSHSKIKSFNTNTTLTPVHSTTFLKTVNHKQTNNTHITSTHSGGVDFGQLSANKKVFLLRNFRDIFDENVIKHKDDKVYTFVKTIPDIKRKSTSCN